MAADIDVDEQVLVLRPGGSVLKRPGIRGGSVP